MTTDQQIEQMIANCRFTTSHEQEQRVLEAAGRVLQERPRPAGVPFSYRRIGLRLAIVASLAAMILVALLLRDNPQTVAWADVQKKVAEQEWILIRGEDHDGETFESWSSMSLKIDAWKNDEHTRFANYKTGVQDYYDAKRGTITRSVDLSDHQRQGFEAVSGLFKALLSGAETVEISLPGVEIVSQTSREVKRHGKKWIEFDLQLREQKHTGRMIFLIEPGSHLIRSMQVIDGGGQMTATFSYPKTGPQSIYDLGVPKRAKVIDLIPSAEMQELIDGVRSSAKKFGPYIALNVMQDANAPWYVGTPQKVWANGKQIRMEYGIVDPTKKDFQKPGPDADEKQWWSERWNQLWHAVVEVSDGKNGYKNNAYPEDWGTTEKPHPVTWDPQNWPEPKWKSYRLDDWPIAVAGSPLFYAYSPNTRQRGRGNEQATLDTKPENGPQGIVLLTYTVESNNPESGSTERFWIDPQRSHIVMKYELIHGPLPGSDRYVVTIKKLAKSPRGVWYPTLVSHKTITEKGGKTTETETLTRHYLDFETEFPEGVFEPKPLPDIR